MKKVTIFIFASLFAILTVGCGGNDEEKPKKELGQRLFEGLIETAIEQSAKQDGKDVDVDIDLNELAESGSMTITDENGKKVTISGKDGEFKMTDSEGEDISISAKDDGIVVKDKDGKEHKVFGTLKEVPDNFPKDVYLVSGDFKSGNLMNQGDGEAINVTIKTKGDFDDVVSKIKKEMKSEDWKKEMDMSMNGESMLSFKKEKRDVLITTKTVNDVLQVSYLATIPNKE